MISVLAAQKIHNKVLEAYGGLQGTRDLALLQSALARPFATFDGIDLYPNPIDKSAAILESIVINHPFLDGNKRTAYVLMRIMLMKFNLDINATQEEKYEFVIAASKGEYRFEEIKMWINSKIIPS